MGVAEFTDLEIRIFPCRPEGYPVEITLGGQQEFPRGWLAAETSGWKASGVPATDGAQLYQVLFTDPHLVQAWAEARGAAQNRRLRLRIDPGAPELHAIPWELLADDQGPLAANPATPFSRYLPVAMPWAGVVQERPVRVLLVVSSPSDLSARELAPIDVQQELQALNQGLAPLAGTVQVDVLSDNVTLEALEAKLREKYHVLHFIGHGKTSTRGQSALVLQNADGTARFVSDDLLAGILTRLPVRPRLVFLVACQSAARSAADAFLGLAPRQVTAGVPAVVAMQDMLTLTSGPLLASSFYQRLAEHGQVDCALNEARASLVTAGRPDAHVPVLFMRLRSGALWSDESNARGQVLGKGPSAAFWPMLVNQVKQAKVVPILGRRVHGRWLPGPDEMARLLAEKYNYPFKYRTDLSQVAQYLATTGGEDYLRLEYLNTLMEAFKAQLPEPALEAASLALAAPADQTLASLVQSADWKSLAARDPNEVHGVLASLGLPLYLSTNPDNLLEEALLGANRQPVREQCLWSDELAYLSTALTDESYPFNPQSPVVYHLFGTTEELQSLVLSEDQYFRYLYNIASVYDRVPSSIRSKMATSALMFVGFSLYDWEFRVVMHGLVKNLQNRFKIRHVAVQLEEADAAGTTEQAVQGFLTQYFSEADINVYWGSTTQFVAELRENWEKSR